jgi:hypothetical protein
VLAVRGQAKVPGSVGAKPQNPFREPLGVKQFARMRDTVNDLAIWVARVCFIEAAQRGLETFRILWVKTVGHGLVLFQNGMPAQGRFRRNPALRQWQQLKSW